MENENLKEVIEMLDVQIGKEQPPITAKPVMVTAIKQEAVKNRDGKDVADKLILIVSHESFLHPMNISGVKYEKNKKLEESGLWLKKDPENMIPYNSALACLMRRYSCKVIKEFVGKQIETVVSDKGYLIAKAY